MSTATASSKLQKLQRQLETAKARCEKLEAKSMEAQKLATSARRQVRELKDAIHAQQIKDLLNVEAAVCIGTVGQNPKLDNLTGTVIRTGRAYAVVRFENGENWKVPYLELCKAEDMAKRPRQYGFLKL
jgi:multidrug resistance efflux pump